MLDAKQSGFTLIELVVVIVILGILAAFAVPRFIDLGTEARIAALDGLSGSLRSAAVLAHSVQLANSLGAGVAISMEGNDITMSNGYPAATAVGISNTQNPTPPSGFTATAGTGSIAFRLTNSPTPASCAVTYTAATATAPPAVSSTTTGCS